MSKTATAEAESEVSIETDPAALAKAEGGVLSMNGEEIELSYNEVMEIRSAILRAKWRANEEDRPATARWLGRVFDRLAPAVGRDE